MDSIKLINISLDIFCGIVDLIILSCMLTVGYKKDSMNRIFIMAILCNFMMLITDIVLCIFDSVEGIVTHYLLRINGFIMFILGPMLLIAFTYYLFLFIKKKGNEVSKGVKFMAYLAVASCCADILFIVITQFNHMYYYIDASNVSHRQDWYILSQVFSLICMIMNVAMIIVCRKRFQILELIFLSFYVLLPAIAVVIQMFVVGSGLIFYSITLTILIFYVGIQSEQFKQLKQKELELTNARVDIMLSQIQPHFLYNTLTTIENMVHKNTDRASKMIIDFSEYLRENMDSLNQRELIPFERELNHVKVYLDFEKMRFKDDLEIIYDCEFTDFDLPILTIQPIVENAVRHGVMKKPKGGTVSISTRRVQDNVVITVTDDGLGFDPSWSADDGLSHVGLENVQNRLMAQCGGTLTIESRKDIGTKAIITVPMAMSDTE